MLAFPPVSPQRYRLRSRSDREVIREVEPGAVYVDRDTGEEFHVVGKVLPLDPSPSRLPWAVENLRLCGCSLEQLTPKDVNDCPHCGRRLPAMARLEGSTGDEDGGGAAAQHGGDENTSERDRGGKDPGRREDLA